MLAKSDLALIIDDLLVGIECIHRFGDVISIILVKFVEELAHDILGLGFFDLLVQLIAV